jgi:hypothetical protein
MDSFITPQDVANVVLFVIPGYFALKTYAIIYAKHDRDFSHVLLESVAYSLPIIAFYTLLWDIFTDMKPVMATARFPGSSPGDGSIFALYDTISTMIRTSLVTCWCFYLQNQRGQDEHRRNHKEASRTKRAS